MGLVVDVEEDDDDEEDEVVVSRIVIGVLSKSQVLKKSNKIGVASKYVAEMVGQM